MTDQTKAILGEVHWERIAQDEKWGEQNHPDGTGFANSFRAQRAIDWTDSQADRGKLTWLDILDEEISEASAESDPEKLREELIQTAAVAVAWVEAIDRRQVESVR